MEPESDVKPCDLVKAEPNVLWARDEVHGLDFPCHILGVSDQMIGLFTLGLSS